MQDAEFLLFLCEKFHCLPSAIDEENADLVRILSIAEMGKTKEVNPPEQED